MGQIYVMLSRVVDPRHLHLIGLEMNNSKRSQLQPKLNNTAGLPPVDMLEDVAKAWATAGLDVAQCLRQSISVTNDWVYIPGRGPILERFGPRLIKETSVPVTLKSLDEIVNPQPEALKVYQNLLAWIEEVDWASQRGAPRPAFKTADGDDIFPGEDRKWWLTDVQKRNPQEPQPCDEDGPISEIDGEKEETDDEDPTSEEGDNQDDVGDQSNQDELLVWSESALADKSGAGQ